MLRGVSGGREVPQRCGLFKEFEEIVNGQMFASVDDIQDRIGAFHLKAVLETGRVVAVEDLQVFPSTGDVSFRLTEALASSGKPV